MHPASAPGSGARRERPGRRSLGARVEGAAPLIVAGLACLVLGISLRSSAALADGRLQVWGLFIALGVVAWVGAGVSAALGGPERSDEALTEPKERRRARRPSDRPTNAARDDLVDLDSEVADEPNPEGEPTDIAPEPRGANDRAVDDWTPAEAIAEIDELQADLERLRRARRTPGA